MIVVPGATGQLGRLVIAALLKKVPASGIVAAVRNIEKARDLAALGVHVRCADYNKPPAWDDALKGADKALLISSKAGLPEAVAALLADSDTGVSKGALFDGGHQLSKLIGRPTTSLAASVGTAMGRT